MSQLRYPAPASDLGDSDRVCLRGPVSATNHLPQVSDATQPQAVSSAYDAQQPDAQPIDSQLPASASASGTQLEAKPKINSFWFANTPKTPVLPPTKKPRRITLSWEGEALGSMILNGLTLIPKVFPTLRIEKDEVCLWLALPNLPGAFYKPKRDKDGTETGSRCGYVAWVFPMKPIILDERTLSLKEQLASRQRMMKNFINEGRDIHYLLEILLQSPHLCDRTNIRKCTKDLWIFAGSGHKVHNVKLVGN